MPPYANKREEVREITKLPPQVPAEEVLTNAMPCALQEVREAVPVTSDADRPVQIARRQVAGTAKGK
jgi:hypothetical protein